MSLNPLTLSLFLSVLNKMFHNNLLLEVIRVGEWTEKESRRGGVGENFHQMKTSQG